jgi:hypothetical protein
MLEIEAASAAARAGAVLSKPAPPSAHEPAAPSGGTIKPPAPPAPPATSPDISDDTTTPVTKQRGRKGAGRQKRIFVEEDGGAGEEAAPVEKGKGRKKK